MTVYRNSEGVPLAIDSMVTPYLRSALALLESRSPERAEEIEAMRAEVAKRAAKLADLVAGYKAEDISVVARPEGYILIGPLGSLLSKPYKTADGAWYGLAASRGEAVGL